jgi:DHA2 family multidrug resistance protein-like MFS transporter
MPQSCASGTAKASRREWIGLGVLALPCLIYSMDLTVLYLAVPQISADLQPSASQLLWIVDIYGFLVAGFLITMGSLGDRIGRRKLLLIGAAAFGAASVLAAFSTSAGMLIASRALLGLTAATLAPSTLSLIRNMFLDDRERSFAIGVWIACFSAGAILGPLVGGVLLHFFWWGSVFLVAVPVMLLLLVLGPRYLPEFKDPEAGRQDLPSVAMSISAVLAVIYGMKRIAEQGVGVVALATIAVGLLLATAFARRQRRLANPLIDLALFRAPAFSAALACNVLTLFIAFGFFLFIAQYFQLVLGMSPLVAGLWTAPSGLVFVVGSMAAPWLARQAPVHWVIAGGLFLSVLGFAMLSQLGSSGFAWLMAGYLLFCAGLAPIGALTTDLVMSSAPPERAGAASGISETSFEFGGALGIAALGSVVSALYRLRMGEALPAEFPREAAAAASDSLGGALAVASRLGEAGELLATSARAAYVATLETAAWICAGLSLLAALAVLALGTRLSTPPSAPPAAATSPGQ